MKHTVLREHFGGRMFRAGDQREAREADVAHLVAAGVLAPSEGEKAAPPVGNKADRPVSNKAAQ